MRANHHSSSVLQGAPATAPLLPPTNVTATQLPCSIHLYCKPGPLGSRGPCPMLLLLLWLGAQPAAQAKYLQLYLACGCDVLAVESTLSCAPGPGASCPSAGAAVRAWGTGQPPTGDARPLPGWLHLCTDAPARGPGPGAPQKRGPVPEVPYFRQPGPHGAG